MHKDEMERRVAEWLVRLPDKQAWVVRRGFGLDGQVGASLDDLAKDLQITTEQVRQMQIEALEALVAELKLIQQSPPSEDKCR